VNGKIEEHERGGYDVWVSVSTVVPGGLDVPPPHFPSRPSSFSSYKPCSPLSQYEAYEGQKGKPHEPAWTVRAA